MEIQDSDRVGYGKLEDFIEKQAKELAQPVLRKHWFQRLMTGLVNKVKKKEIS